MGLGDQLGEKGSWQEWEAANRVMEGEFDDYSIVKNKRKYKIK